MKRARSTSLNVLPLPTVGDWKLLHNSVLALLPSGEQLRRSLTPSSGKCPHLKIAAFDLDDTLIMPKNGAVFPRDDPTDWKWLTPVVPARLRFLHDVGFMVVLFSNQAGIAGKQWNEKKAGVIKRKVLQLCEELEIPLAAFLATKNDEWRKPNVGMWTVLRDYVNDTLKEDVGISNEFPGSVFYVGDAAGRRIPTLAGRKKDFSCSDRKFAFNIGIPFLTPEEFYLCPQDKLLEKTAEGGSEGQCAGDSRLSASLLTATLEPCTVDWGGVSPAELSALPQSYEGLTIDRTLANGTKDVMKLPVPATFHRASQEMVVFVGFPGCGKTTFYERFFRPHGYVHINRDKLVTKEKCIAEAKKWWNAGESIVIDNTNPSHGDCKVFIDVVRQASVKRSSLPVRVFLFQTSKEMSMHLANVRTRLGVGPKIGRVAYNVYQSKFEDWTAETVRAMEIEELLAIPHVVCFDGLPVDTEKEFFLLS